MCSVLIVPGDIVITEAQRTQYLARAKEAETQAKTTADEAHKAAWLRIAAGYHDLAARDGGKSQN